MQNKAFTLAEVLITLGIIGIVAAMTLPAIIEDTRERQTIIKLKKAYSVLQNVSLKVRAEHGDLNMWSDDSKEFFMKEVSKNLKVIKECNQGILCSRSFAYSYPAVILSDGTALAFPTRQTNSGNNGGVCSSPASERRRINLHYNYCATVLVDINADKKPNKLGEDVFEFRFFTNGVVPNGVDNVERKQGYPNVAAENFTKCLDNKGGHGACTAWAVIMENRDYLRCPEKIDWDKASSCKDK